MDRTEGYSHLLYGAVLGLFSAALLTSLGAMLQSWRQMAVIQERYEVMSQVDKYQSEELRILKQVMAEIDRRSILNDERLSALLKLSSENLPRLHAIERDVLNIRNLVHSQGQRLQLIERRGIAFESPGHESLRRGGDDPG